MKRAIISGATGAIGTALIKELLKQKTEVLVLTRKDSARNQNIPANELITTKYCSLAELCKLENDTGKTYDIFYHLAWAGASGPGRNDKELQDKNVEYALDAVRCAKRFGCRKFIGVGSQAEYGRVNIPLTADLQCHPENEYGRAKLEAGIKTKSLANEIGLEHNWVRVLSIYGVNDGVNSLISYSIRQLKNQEPPELTKGEQTWDYLFSEDAAVALRLIGEKGINGKTYVLGSGTFKKLKDYIEIIKEIISPSTSVHYGARPYPDKQVMYLVADITELNKDTGWSPKTNFESGIRKILENE